MKAIAIVTGVGLCGVVWSGAQAEVARRSTPEHRPYIVEIGEPQAIGIMRFNKEIALNSDLREYVGKYGYPDVAEVQEIAPSPNPWATYEVRLYYLRPNVTAHFGRVHISPMVTDFGVIKYHDEIPAEDYARVVNQPRLCDRPSGDAYTRVAAAADRAARAADAAEMAAQSAAAAADRAAQRVEQMERSFHQRLMK